jgi:hypothetical protein
MKFVDALLPLLSHLLACHNDVIDAEPNNRVFALGSDMDLTHFYMLLSPLK